MTQQPLDELGRLRSELNQLRNELTIGGLRYGQSQAIQVPTAETDPEMPRTGQMYWNSISASLMVYNGSAWVDILFASCPIGGIMYFSGAIVDIPSGFQLCDGSNGTPDLRDRFIVGAGSTFNPDDVGGSATQANHSLGSHDHNDFPHDHTLDKQTVGVASGVDSIVLLATTAVNNSTDAVPNDGSATLTHGTNQPPYYALAAIMRVS